MLSRPDYLMRIMPSEEVYCIIFLINWRILLGYAFFILF